MKYLSAITGLSLFALAASAALPEPDLIAHVYFAGAEKISAQASAAAFTNGFCSAEALALRAQTATKLAAWLGGWLGKDLKQSAAQSGMRFRPLLDDLQKSEWLLEARADANSQPELGIAIKLERARAEFWQANLKPFFAAATFKSTGGWLVFDSNPALLALGDRLAHKVSAPPSCWFEADVNWPRLAQWHPQLKDFGLPETRFAVSATADKLRMDGTFYFPNPLALKLEPWKLPVETIGTPFCSFTAVRGFAAWWQSQAWAQPYQIAPLPNQLFCWALPSVQYQTYAALPVTNAVSAMTQLYDRLVPAFGAATARGALMGPVKPEVVDNSIHFTGLPFVALRLLPLTEAAGQFLYLEAFPNSLHAKPFPADVQQRLAATNLVFYHWETTSERIPQMLRVNQLALMVTAHQQLDGRSTGFKWMQKSGGTPGISDTEITQSGPSELTFTRQGPGLFTAMELFSLASWLEATNFPGCDLRVPESERLEMFPNPPAAAPAATPHH